MKNKKVYFDTEFTGLHKNTSLISIGLIDEDGNEFYAELSDYNRRQTNEWLKENVIKHLISENEDLKDTENINYYFGDKQKITKELSKWFSQFGEVELVSDVCHYDMVLLIDLFGTAFDLPPNVSAACYDINQDIARAYNVSSQDAFNISREGILKDNGIVISGTKHTALYDSKVIKALYEVFNKI